MTDLPKINLVVLIKQDDTYRYFFAQVVEPESTLRSRIENLVFDLVVKQRQPVNTGFDIKQRIRESPFFPQSTGVAVVEDWKIVSFYSPDHPPAGTNLAETIYKDLYNVTR